MYLTIRCRVSLIMDVIQLELSELSALELEELPCLTLFTLLASVNIDQSAPNLVAIDMTNRSQMSSHMHIIRLKHLESFALELEKIAEFDLVYTLASTNINLVNHLPNLVNTYVTIRSQIIDLIRTDW